MSVINGVKLAMNQEVVWSLSHGFHRKVLEVPASEDNLLEFSSSQEKVAWTTCYFL